jgi:syntaxin 16
MAAAPRIGYIRDRTAAYSDFRAQTYRTSVPGVFTDNLSPDPKSAPLDLRLVRQAAEIDNQFITLDSEMSVLRRLCDERLRPTLESSGSLDAQIEAISVRVSQLIGKLRDEIRCIAQSSSMASAMRHGHAARLRRVALQFREMQTTFLRRLQTAQERAGLLPDRDDQPLEFDVAFTGGQVSQLQEVRRDVEMRNEQIRRLLPMIHELTSMFADLETLIVDQGTMLDRIDGHLDEALDGVRAANSAMRAAEKQQVRSTKWFILYMVLMIVLILILGTIIIVRKENSAKGATAAPEPEKR